MYSMRQAAKDQPDSFSFTKENQKKIKEILKKYPNERKRSGIIPLLDIAQRQHGNWIPRAAMDVIAELVGVAPIRVYEVATFYTMFNLSPVGKNFIQVCRTTPCWLRGSDDITETCKKKLGIELGETTEDGQFSLIEVECLGACVNAPMVQVNDDYYEDLSPKIMEKIIDDLTKDKKVNVGTQIDRINSAPEGGLTTLKKAPANKTKKTTKKTKK